MTRDQDQDAASDDRHRAAFAAIILLLRQLAHQLLEQGNPAESRGIVDGLEALEAKTRGNLDEGEARFLTDVLFELRLAIVKGPSPAGESPEPNAE
jgi:hypothetical protein